MERIITYYEKEKKELFSNWNMDRKVQEDSLSPFVLDGVVVPEKWFQQKVRPLFVLKEAYSSKKEDWDETEWLSGNYHTKIYSKTFKCILQWTYIIEKKELPTKIDYKWDNGLFKTIALMNIKKYGGRNPSDNNNLKNHAQQHAQQIIKQIELIQPTIIVCGYTCWLLDIAYANCNQKIIRENKNQNYSYNKIISNKEVQIIDFYHPAAIKSDKELEDKLLAILLNESPINFSHSEKGVLTRSDLSPTPN